MKKTLIFGFYFVAIAMVLFSCNTTTTSEVITTDEHQVDSSETKKSCDGIHWTHHEGEEGQANWKNLCDGFLSCGGSAQSPINITTTETSGDTSLSDIKFNYGVSGVNIINNGHTVQFNISGNNTIQIKGKEYKLLQFHYHAKSEHTIDNAHYPIEVHFVHQYSETDYAVIGIMFQEGEVNELLGAYLAQFPAKNGNYTSENQIELSKLVPANLSYYYYSGSLTTPPCSEVVNWYVLKTPLKASKEQIEKFSAILHDNYRKVMPLNDRKVLSFDK